MKKKVVRDLKVGDVVKIKEFLSMSWRRIVKAKVIKIYNKGKYNMYLCEYLESGMKTCVTDQDLYFLKTVVKE